MADNIFAGNVFEKFNGDVLDVRLEAAVLRQGVYTGQDRDGNPCQYVNVSVKKSRQGNWYVVLDTYRKDNPAPPRTNAQQDEHRAIANQCADTPPPQQAAPPRGNPPPFPTDRPAAPPAAPAPAAPPPQAPAAPQPDQAFDVDDSIDDIPF